MKKVISLFLILMIWNLAFSQKSMKKEFETSKGKLEVNLVGHGSVYFKFNNLVIHVDPFSSVADYSKLPKADIIFITHSHFDHCDTIALAGIMKSSTKIYCADDCKAMLKKNNVTILKNGEKATVSGIKVEVVPAYNLLHKNEDGNFFHPKGEGNGYVFTFGNKRVYVAGDTEDIPEMKNLKKIDIAFLPMNLPYTMTPEMCANAAKMFLPKNLFSYHYGETDLSKIKELLKDVKQVKIILGE